MNKPFVIVVTGRPGSGKTTLAHTLAKHIAAPRSAATNSKKAMSIPWAAAMHRLGRISTGVSKKMV